MTEKAIKTLTLTGLFASFMYLQFVVLRLANGAGSGFLSVERQEQVYYWLQVFVILGFLAYAFLHRRAGSGRTETAVLRIALAGLFAGTVFLLLGSSSPVYLAVCFAALLCLGFTGGAVYRHMALQLKAGGPAALSMGFGCALATALQYLLQLRFTVVPLLLAFAAASAAWLFYSLRPESAGAESLLTNGCAGASAGIDVSGTTVSQHADLRRPVTGRTLLFVCLITAAILLFTGFYNSYIHHLQVVSGYTAYNVYTWPRLVWIPCYIFFGFLGSRREGRLVPLAALCFGLVALLNTVLTGVTGAYWLNMCLFYAAIAASVSYYDLRFWRLAHDTRHPALWACMGRVLDSFMVILQGVLHLGSLTGAVVLSLDIAALAAVIVLMSISGDLDFRVPEKASAAAVPPDEDERLSCLTDRFGFTPKEAAVFRELVLTEKDQRAMAESLEISLRTLQAHITSLYRKTGTGNRAGLIRMFRETE